MNPYVRFGLISNSVSAALIVGALAVFGPPVFEAVTSAAGGTGPAMWVALGAAVTVLVVFWLAMTEAIFPTLFRFNLIRKLVLGKYYVEGTWLQAEKGDGTKRMSVIDIQPDGKSFIFSGYALNEDLEIESNTLIEFSRFDWPFMTYKYRNSLSDGADGQREGVGEIQFEMNRAAAKRYNGYAQYVKNEARLNIEGTKLTSNAEVRRLRSLDGRQKIFERYWDLFFNRSLRKAPQPAHHTAAAHAPQANFPGSPDFVERRAGETPTTAETGVIPRRRASDWSREEATAKDERPGTGPANVDAGLDKAEDALKRAEANLDRLSETKRGPDSDYRKRSVL